MESPWFASWFDSPYYPLLYRHRDDTEAERFIDRLLQALAPKPQAHFLDLACGRGRHARYLHAQGYTATGLDLSPASIADAQLHVAPGLDFEVHDMRDPYPGQYDYILNLFTSFGYFEHKADNRRVLRNVAAALKTSGTFVMDFMNAQRVLERLVPHESSTLDDVRFDITRSVEDGVIVKRIHVDDQGRQFDFVERVQALTKAELEEMLAQAGLKVDQVWGNYQGAPYDGSNSDRVILFARGNPA